MKWKTLPSHSKHFKQAWWRWWHASLQWISWQNYCLVYLSCQFKLIQYKANIFVGGCYTFKRTRNTYKKWCSGCYIYQFNTGLFCHSIKITVISTSKFFNNVLFFFVWQKWERKEAGKADCRDKGDRYKNQSVFTLACMVSQNIDFSFSKQFSTASGSFSIWITCKWEENDLWKHSEHITPRRLMRVSQPSWLVSSIFNDDWIRRSHLNRLHILSQ